MKTAYQIDHNEYLQHYGIKGQKWGVRNGPPYPLGASQKSASEKKASFRKSLDKVDNKTHTESVSGIVDKDNQKRGLTEKQKRILKVGATVAAAALVTYGAYKLKESGKLDPLIAQGKGTVEQLLGKSKVVNGEDVSKWKVGDISRGKSLNGDVPKFSMSAETKARVSEVGEKYEKFGFKDIVNPTRNVDEIGKAANSRCFNDDSDPENFLNCKENSLTFFMRKVLGKDVVSPSRTVDGGLKDFVARYFKDDPDAVVATINTRKNEAYKGLNAEQVAKKFIEGRMNSDNPKRKFYDGDCGAFGCDEAGHTISWFIENGKVFLFNVKQSKDSSKTADWLDAIPLGSTYQIVNYSQLNPAESLKDLYD